MRTIKTRHVFKYKHTKWSHWCITSSLNYKNTMINRITMETVACLRSKCHLKQNLIPSWPWSFRHTSFPISGAKQNTQTTNFVGQPDRHTWQYCRSLWFSARLVQRSEEFQKVSIVSSTPRLNGIRTHNVGGDI
jgi:hypothetical protein